MKKKRHLNLRMNPRVSCDCDFFRGGEGDFKTGGRKKCLHMYCMFLSSSCLHVSSLFAFLFWPGVTSHWSCHVEKHVQALYREGNWKVRQ